MSRPSEASKLEDELSYAVLSLQGKHVALGRQVDFCVFGSLMVNDTDSFNMCQEQK